MDGVRDMLNEPTEFAVSGMTLRVRRLGMLHKVAIAERVARDRAVADIRERAEAFSDPAARDKWVAGKLDALPPVDELATNISKAGDYDFILTMLSEATGLPAEQVDVAMSEGTEAEVRPLIAFLVGKKNSPAVQPSRKTSSSRSVKGTGGGRKRSAG